MGVHSAARFGANVAAPPLMFQLVTAPTSRMATVSFLVSPVPDDWFVFLLSILCPKTGRDGNKQTTEGENAFFRI